MKKTIKILSVLLSLCMLLALLPAVSLAETLDYYAVYYKGELTFCYGEKMGDTVYCQSGDKVDGGVFYTDFLNGDHPWSEHADDIQTVTILNEIHPTSTADWFYKCKNLQQVNGLDCLVNDELTTMENMFYGCSALTALDFGCNNQRSSDPPVVSNMFDGCTSLSSLYLWDYFPLTGAGLPDAPGYEPYTGYWTCGDGSTAYSVSDIEALSGTKDIGTTWVWQTVAVPVERIECSPDNMVINVGESYQITATVYPLNATNKSVYFRYDYSSHSYDPQNRASVDSSTGVVTGLYPGSFTIYCFSWANPAVCCYIHGTVVGTPAPSTDPAYAVYRASDNSLTFCTGSKTENMNMVVSSSAGMVSGDAVYEGFETGYDVPWSEHAGDIKTVTFLDTVTPVSTASWFSKFSQLEQINGLDKLHTESVTNMFGMFFGCEALQSLDISLLNTGNVGDMEEMFACCSSLESLDLSNNSFDFGKLNNTIKMLGDCNALSTLILPKYFPIADAQLSDPPTNTPYTGYWIKDGDTSTHYKTSQIEALSGTSDVCGTWTWETNTIPAGGHGVYAVVGQDDYGDELHTLTFCVGTLEADGVHRDAGGEPVVGSAYYTDFLNLNADGGDHDYAPWTPDYSFQSGIQKVVFLDEIAPTSTARWFSNMPYLSVVEGLDKLNTSNVTNMSHMFGHDKSPMTKYRLKSLDVSHFDTHNVTNMYRMFGNCAALTELDVSGFDTSNVENMVDMFECCEDLVVLDVSHFNTSKVQSMSSMFRGCESLTALDVSGFDTSNVYDMRSMFAGCKSLTAIDVSHFNTEKIGTSDDDKGGGDLKYMFSGCIALKALDLSSFKIGNITDEEDSYLDCMLENCTALSSIKLGKDFRFTWTAYDHGEPYEENVELPDVPTTAPYTGNWIKIGGDDTQYTSQQLMSAYDGSDAMVGTWVWEGTPTAVDLSGATVTAADRAYTGSPVTTTVTVVLDGVTLRQGTDYTVSYANNTSVGTASVTVTGIGAYTGSAFTTFNIRAASPTGGDLADGEVIRATHSDTGDGNTATFEVLYNGSVLVNGTDYTLSVLEYIEQNKIVVTATGIGAYTGSVSATFNYKTGCGCSCGNTVCTCDHDHTSDTHDSGTTDETNPGSGRLSFLEIIRQLFQKLVEFFKKFC